VPGKDEITRRGELFEHRPSGFNSNLWLNVEAVRLDASPQKRRCRHLAALSI